MRICIMNVVREPYDKKLYYKEALGLVDAGHEVIIIGPGEEDEVSEDGVVIKTFSKHKRTLSGVWSFVSRFFSLFSLFRVGKSVDVDVYHCREPDSWLVGLGLKILKGKPVIVEVAEHFPSLVAKRFPSKMNHFIERILILVMNIMAFFTDKLVLAGEGLSEDIFPYVSSSKKEIILNCSKYEPVHKQNVKGKDEFELVYIGRLNSSRGSNVLLDSLISAMEADPAIKATIVGDFYKDGAVDDEYREWFLKKFEEKGFEDNIRVTGWVSFWDVPEKVQNSDVGLFLTSSQEKNPNYGPANKLFDYMALGLPVIASKFIRYPKIITDNHCGLLVDSNDPELLSEKILFLKNNIKELENMRNNSLEVVKNKYNWGNQLKKLILVYEEVVGVNEE